MIAAHEKGEEKLAAKKLTELWRNIRRGDILQNWGFPGPMRGFYDRSFFDNTPELHLLQRKFKEYGGKLRRRFTLGITDAQTGDYIVKNQDVGDENIPHYILASSSVPGIFPYIVEGSHVFIDGGTVNNLNLRGGIEECYKLGAEEEDIVIDLIMTNPRISSSM